MGREPEPPDRAQPCKTRKKWENLCADIDRRLSAVYGGIADFCLKTEPRREEQNMKKLEEYVRSIPDFPEPGIIFRDVTSILQDADGLCLAVDSLIDMVKDLDYDLVGEEAEDGPRKS